MYPKPNSLRNAGRGFTLLEVMIVCGISGVALSLCSLMVMGFQIQTQTAIRQLQARLQSQKAIEIVGRNIMHSTKVEVEGEPNQTQPQRVHVWRDNQVIWTPETTDDDTEGAIYLHTESHEMRYCPDINAPEDFEVMTWDVEEVEFSMSDQALFMEVVMRYDPDIADSERKMLASFVVRNNPKLRQGASQ